jgi:hypothetical protein
MEEGHGNPTIKEWIKRVEGRPPLLRLRAGAFTRGALTRGRGRKISGLRYLFASSACQKICWGPAGPVRKKNLLRRQTMGGSQERPPPLRLVAV